MSTAERRVFLLVAALVAEGLGRIIDVTPPWMMRRTERDALQDRLRELRHALEHVDDPDET